MKTTLSTLIFAIFCIAVQAQSHVSYTYVGGNRVSRAVITLFAARYAGSSNTDSSGTVANADSSSSLTSSLQNTDHSNSLSQNAELAEGGVKNVSQSGIEGGFKNGTENKAVGGIKTETETETESEVESLNKSSTESKAEGKSNAENTAENNNTSQTFKETLGIGQSITIYPNPTKGALQLSFTGIAELSSASLHLFDLQGKEVYSKTNIAEREEINFTSSPTGAYILKIFVSGKTKEWTVIKE